MTWRKPEPESDSGTEVSTTTNETGEEVTNSPKKGKTMEETIEKQDFHIDSESSATWLLSKVRRIDEEQEAIKAATAQRLAELTTDRERLMGRFAAELEAWARQEAEARRRKTITLPLAGYAVSFRAVPSRLVVESEADAITTARAVAPETVTQETTERFDKAAFLAYAKAHLEATGEILPGLTQSEERESFSVKPVKKATGEE